MSDVSQLAAVGDLRFLDEETIERWMIGQRWFGSKAREVTTLRPLAALPLRDEPPLLIAGLMEARFAAGTHEVYQVLFGLRPESEGWEGGVIANTGGWTVYDALADPVHGRALLELMRSGSAVEGVAGTGEFHSIDGLPEAEHVRSLSGEQSNSSIVYDSASVLKVYRRVEAGINPELELLRFLSARGFPHIARLSGWYAFSGRLMDATLGVLQDFIPDSRDGWELALDEMDGDRFIGRVRDLGAVTGRMHSALASDPTHPDFAPEEPSVEALSLLMATVEDEIARIFRDLPHVDAVAPIAGRGEEVRERLRLFAQVAAGGMVIRHHGDYHLGQTLLSDRGWVVLDFEGEPARTLPERRRKRSPLRDVAGMLRSFAYAASASRRLRGVEPPADWERRAREEFLAGYLDAVDPMLLPPGPEATQRLLAVFELEKAVYELRYELNNRPDWVDIPVEGIARLLEEDQ